MKKLKELLERRAEFLDEAGKDETTAERFNELREKIKRIDEEIEMTKKQDAEQRAIEEAQQDEEQRAARLPSGGTKNPIFDQRSADEARKKSDTDKEMESRAAKLKNGEKVEFEARSVTTVSAAISEIASNTINPAFTNVGTLDTLVQIENLAGSGAESYKKPYVKTEPTGDITGEGEDYATAEPTFDYASINKIKITAYAEVSKEITKLPPANYVAVVEKSVKNAIRVKKIQQIVNGSGVDQMLGIVNAPVSMIPANCTKTITSIDENTLEEIIFEYGGDENVEGDAFIILNKLTLKEFSKVKGTDKKRAYDIVVRGNAGTINGIPFVCTSAVSAYKNDLAAGVPYLIYGKLAGYVLAEFSNIEVEKSTDYKFKQGMIAYRAEQMVGGSPAMYKGFMKVQRAAAN